MAKINRDTKIYKQLPAALAGLAFMLQAASSWSLTLPEAVDLAIKHYPDVRAADEYRQSLEQKLRKEFAGFLPKVDFSAGYGRENSDNPTTRGVVGQHDLTLDRGETGLTLSQMVFDGFDVQHKVQQAEARLLAAHANMQSVSDSTALRAVQAYVDVVIKQAQWTLTKENVTLHERILGKVRQKFQGGAGTQADVHQAASRTYLASAGQASNQAAYHTAQAKFVEIIGRTPPSGMLQPEAPEDLLPGTLQEALDMALAHNPGLAGARHGLKALEAEHESAKSPFWPRVDLELGATNNANMAGSEGHSKSASAMLRMRYNFYQGGADLAEVRGSRDRVEQAQQDLDKKQRFLMEQLTETWSKLQTSRERVRFLSKHVDVSKQVTASYHDQFKMGKRTLLDVLNSENELFGAKNAMLFENLTHIKTAYEVLTHMGVLQAALSARFGLASTAERVEGWANDTGVIVLDTVIVDRPRLNMRSGSGLHHPVVKVLDQETRLVLKGVVGRWLHVEDSEGVEGWVASYLTRHPDTGQRLTRAERLRVLVPVITTDEVSVEPVISQVVSEEVLSQPDFAGEMQGERQGVAFHETGTGVVLEEAAGVMGDAGMMVPTPEGNRSVQPPGQNLGGSAPKPPPPTSVRQMIPPGPPQ